MIYGGRGKDCNRKFKSEIIKKTETLLKIKYYDFQPTHVMEKLEEDDDIKMSKETARSIMIDFEL